MEELGNRVVLVTGGSAGIGRETVAELGGRGARVLTCARHGARLEEALTDLPGVTGVVADVADAADRAMLIDRVVEDHGRLDALVLNAGLGWAGLLEDTPGEVVEDVVPVNLTAAIELTRLALPHLLASARRTGRADVVAVSSVAAWTRIPPLTVYSATKAGLDGFVKGLRREVTARGLRVHTVNPFFVATEWLARGHGHPPVSDADGVGRLSRGIAPERVAVAGADCLSSPRSRTVAVPRWAGLARLGEVTPVNRCWTGCCPAGAGPSGGWPPPRWTSASAESASGSAPLPASAAGRFPPRTSPGAGEERAWTSCSRRALRRPRGGGAPDDLLRAGHRRRGAGRDRQAAAPGGIRPEHITGT